MKLVAAIASSGRPSELAHWKSFFERQSIKPALVFYSVVSEDDLPPLAERYQPSQVLIGSPGSCIQRNRILDSLPLDHDIIVFFDDDYVPEKECCQNIIEFMSNYPDIVGVSGLLLADGAKSRGLSYIDAVTLVEEYEKGAPIRPLKYFESVGLYGCNMAFRISAIGRIRFDQNLPLYGWQEDVDFAMQVSAKGKIVNANAFVGVHRGVKSGKTSGIRFGYSQVANPIYLIMKGTMPWRHGIGLVAKNILANHWKSIAPEPWIDRHGRLKGNWLAIKDCLRLRLRPCRIREL